MNAIPRRSASGDRSAIDRSVERSAVHTAANASTANGAPTALPPPAGSTQTLSTLARTLAALDASCDTLLTDAPDATTRAAIIARGFFRPLEDEQLADWLSSLLSLHNALWDIIRAVDAIAGVPLRRVHSEVHWRCFVLGYSAACLLVRIDRFVLEDFATHPLIQRKLNEPFAGHGIGRKSYTTLFERYTDPRTTAWLYEAMLFAHWRRRTLRTLEDDAIVGRFAADRRRYQRYLDPRPVQYLANRLRYLRHAHRRRLASLRQQSMFAMIEHVGRTASTIRLDLPKHVAPPIRERLAALLEPGDVLVTRHHYALTNVFLPGYWPHAALYVGTAAERDALGIVIDEEVRARWHGDVCTLEALKDGVRLRPLAETLAVDSCVVLRPALSPAARRAGIERALRHEGKGYNFDFDFFRSDRLVCTEVIYRAFDGLDGLAFTLTERAGVPMSCCR